MKPMNSDLVIDAIKNVSKFRGWLMSHSKISAQIHILVCDQTMGKDSLSFLRNQPIFQIKNQLDEVAEEISGRQRIQPDI